MILSVLKLLVQPRGLQLQGVVICEFAWYIHFMENLNYVIDEIGQTFLENMSHIDDHVGA